MTASFASPAIRKPPAATGTGLKGQYYDNKDFTGLSLTRTDASVNFNWALGAPAPSMGSDTYSVRWTGTVKPRYSQVYTFHTTTDDGARLWVDGQLLVNKWIDQGATTWSGTTSIVLQAGVSYSITMDFYDNAANASAKLEWSSASQQREIVPQSQLYPAP